MKWYEITIATTEIATEMISNFLHESGAGGVSIEESGTLNKPRDTSFGQWYDTPLNDIPEGQAIIKGYFSEETDMEQLIHNIKPRVEGLHEFGIDPGKVEYSYIEVDDEDWATAWKDYFHPIRITDRITIKPTWENYEPEDGELIIELDPGMAFGTGTHPTTSLCLKTLENVIKGGEEVIDVGTGSGVLAIGAMKLGAKHVLALDLDPVAVSSATENVSLNGLSDNVDVHLSDLLGVLRQDSDKLEALKVKPPVDIVVANILAEIIMLFIDDVYEALRPDGTYIASGIWKNKEDVVEQALQAAGFIIENKFRDEDWLAFVARKPKVE
ncbi:50S ribosomal protein L11 methyltransferase [Paenibacillus camelliae]|uniref:50S ribosomal protein L11 methyltransferase n=1 Tax=Paenibacillus camelliae TaxID=512410 RepID=UPI00203EA957|nr:50S ribosomal protein L11 methyltransferase [Paenibacillus camelliae]MCM3633252.1 50S ribosomal protein L11 methyltransferase [Paenibacillus camelliae]